MIALYRAGKTWLLRMPAGSTSSTFSSWCSPSDSRAGVALRDFIAGGKANPSFIVSHELPLDQAPEGYKNFDDREDGWPKAILHPAAA